MSYLHRVVSTSGRLVPKPNSDLPQEDFPEETVVPIHDRIENLRIKIGLKDRHNRVLIEELEESRQGTTSILLDLFIETRELRYRLVLALNSEVVAVQKALRSYRIFQLALAGRNTYHAVQWLDDKLFDHIKLLNRLLYDLHVKRRCLEEAETMVVMLEKWPRPGTLPWELMAIARFQELENTIEDVRIKWETMQILYLKYDKIKLILREEQGKYKPAQTAQEIQLKLLRDELKSLQKMHNDAVLFRDEARHNLTLTEKEAYENRKERRREMSRCKKSLSQALQENNPYIAAKNAEKDNEKSRDHITLYEFIRSAEEEAEDKIENLLKVKHKIAQEFEGRTRKLVATMRVNDLTVIPARLKLVAELSEYLIEQLAAMGTWRNILIKQRDQLDLLLCHFRYTGENKVAQFLKEKSHFEENLEGMTSNLSLIKKRQFLYDNITIDLRIGVISVLQHLQVEKQKRIDRIPKRSLKGHLNHAFIEIRKLVAIIAEFEQLFQGKEAERNYTSFVKPPVVHARLIRIEEPVIEEDHDDDYDMPDLKVPGRLEIKMRSERFIQQAILKRGLK